MAKVTDYYVDNTAGVADDYYWRSIGGGEPAMSYIATDDQPETPRQFATWRDHMMAAWRSESECIRRRVYRQWMAAYPILAEGVHDWLIGLPKPERRAVEEFLGGEDARRLGLLAAPPALAWIAFSNCGPEPEVADRLRAHDESVQPRATGPQFVGNGGRSRRALHVGDRIEISTNWGPSTTYVIVGADGKGKVQAMVQFNTRRAGGDGPGTIQWLDIADL